MSENVIEKVAAYYTDRLKSYGATPAGVDWNSEASQVLRFEQITRLIPPCLPDFSIVDYGSGYGALYEFLANKYGDQFKYFGFDVSDEMVNVARKKYASNANFFVTSALDQIPKSDFLVSSGIFNVKFDFGVSDWESYVISTIDYFNSITVMGFSFNMLTKYSDKEYMRENLYYPDPSFYFDYCKTHFSKYVALLHDYPLYEFTLIVKK
jgi:SAM-dependent methyltransferase